MRRKNGFTLIELLAVMAIIGLLASMLLTALVAARRQAKKTRARADIDQIVTAWQTYLTEYRQFPKSVTVNSMIPPAIKVLTGENTAENPRKIPFVDFRHGTTNSYNDPWGHVYHVELDYDGDGAVNPKGVNLRSVVAVWSDGGDGVQGTKDDLESWTK